MASANREPFNVKEAPRLDERRLVRGRCQGLFSESKTLIVRTIHTTVRETAAWLFMAHVCVISRGGESRQLVPRFFTTRSLSLHPSILSGELWDVDKCLEERGGCSLVTAHITVFVYTVA